MLQCLRALVRPLARPIKQFINNELEEKIRTTLKVVPITEFHPDDVFIVGYPKSGNTWLQNLVTGVIYGLDPEHTPDTVVQDLVPDVHYKGYYKRYRTPMFFKSHHLPRPEYKRVVYLLRDGRDVMVSYFHHNRALKGDDKVDFIRMIKLGEHLYPCKWHEHVEAWLSNPYDAQMITIKYEDLKSSVVRELKRFCEFVGVEREDSFLELVVMKNSFEKMRQKEIRYGWDNPQWPKDNLFVRSGQVGGYRDEMPLDVLEAFNHDADDTLHKCGYS